MSCIYQIVLQKVVSYALFMLDSFWYKNKCWNEQACWYKQACWNEWAIDTYWHIKLWTLEDEEANPKYLGKVKVEDGKSHVLWRRGWRTQMWWIGCLNSRMWKIFAGYRRKSKFSMTFWMKCMWYLGRLAIVKQTNIEELILKLVLILILQWNTEQH